MIHPRLTLLFAAATLLFCVSTPLEAAKKAKHKTNECSYETRAHEPGCHGPGCNEPNIGPSQDLPVALPEGNETVSQETATTLNYYQKLERFIYHKVNRFVSDTVIALEDGSQWSASLYDADTLSNWRPNDWVTITRNSTTDAEYGYYLNNYTTGSSVAVNLEEGPTANGPSTYTVVGMDYNYGKVYLSNGTYWEVQQEDIAEIQDWEKKHTVIIGHNDGWFTSYKTLLINVNLKTAIFAKEI